MTFINPGTPRIAILNTDGSTNRMLYLPAPDRGSGVAQEWQEKSILTELIDGSEQCRRLGWIPSLTLKWAIYNDVLQNTPYSIGVLNGQMASYDTLMSILDGAPGTLKISPGPSAGGFVVQSVKTSPVGIAGPGLAAGLQVTFRGGAICPTKTLGVF